MKKAIIEMFCIAVILFFMLSVAVLFLNDPLTYGQVISKQHIPKHLEELKQIDIIGIPGITYKNIIIPDKYIVVIEGYTAKRVLKQKTICLSRNQYDYTAIGDFVDIGRGN